MNFFDFLKIFSRHRRMVLNGPEVLPGHQRVVFDRKWAAKHIFSKKNLTSKNGLQTPFLALEGLKLRKSGILRGHNPNFLAKRERSIASPVWEKRGHNHPKSLYRTDFWISASFDFECALNARYAQKLLWRLYKRHVKMASKIPEHEFFWFSQNRF